jgi:3-deoxy-7-phosphoheptulonate synthase
MKLISPADLASEYKVTEEINKTVWSGRKAVEDILKRKDRRMLVIVGPCSIHDEKSALEYARKLAQLHHKMKDRLEIIMRVYFEKPRTTIGWKGLINDPHLNGSNDIETGLKLARKLLIEINSMGLPAATELLDPIVPQFIADLVSWVAIGARTTESQTHREMASGLSMPVGFKNNTDGNLQSAIDALQSANHPHSFLGIDHEGRISIINTRGNSNGHVILRGGRLRPNYDVESVREAEEKLKAAGTDPLIMVDCSHANSNKVPEQQEIVWKSIIDQRSAGNENLAGLMLESHLFAGNQPLKDPANLRYGISITDACINWETTEYLLEYAYDNLKDAVKA